MARDEALRELAVRGLGKVGSSWEGAWLHREVLRKSLEDRKEQAGPGGGAAGGPRHLHRIPRLSEAPWEVP